MLYFIIFIIFNITQILVTLIFPKNYINTNSKYIFEIFMHAIRKTSNIALTFIIFVFRNFNADDL